MNIRIFMGIKMCQAIDHSLRLLCGRRIVEPNQGSTVDALGQDRKIPSHSVHIKDRLEMIKKIVMTSARQMGARQTGARVRGAHSHGGLLVGVRVLVEFADFDVFEDRERIGRLNRE